MIVYILNAEQNWKSTHNINVYVVNADGDPSHLVAKV